MSTTLEYSALEKLVRPISRQFSRELAQALVAVQPDADVQDRYDYLAGKNTEGTLSGEERAELEAFVRANTFLQILKLEASAALRVSPGY